MCVIVIVKLLVFKTRPVTEEGIEIKEVNWDDTTGTVGDVTTVVLHRHKQTQMFLLNV